MKVELLKGVLRVSRGEQSLSLAAHPDAEAEENTLVVSLDEVATWDPPSSGAAITIEELQRITEAVERFCSRLGIAVEFD